MSKREFTVKGREFYLNGKPFVIMSGAIHYFRTPAYYWHDRLLKLKECGLNTVETYVAWNVHEPVEGQYNFDGDADLIKFIEIAQELGLYVILRPGPYICAEWEFGGLPAWLLSYDGIELRTNNKVFLEKTKRFFDVLLPLVRPCLFENGGNIIMLQVENEYGSYGDDKEYLTKLKEIYQSNQMNCLYCTADGVGNNNLINGGIDGAYPFFTFGSSVKKQMTILKGLTDGPLMVMEMWCGWFDHWHEEHHTRTTDNLLPEIETLLKNNYNFNIYMFHGGTNFGFMNGANFAQGKHMPTVTSYDYCALLNEAGDLTPTYFAVKRAIEEHTGVNIPVTATNSNKRAYGKVEFTHSAELFDNLDTIGKKFVSSTPLTMEKMGQSYGYALYSTQIHQYPESGDYYEDNTLFELSFFGLADRAQIFLDGEKVATYERGIDEYACYTFAAKGESRLTVLVENMGHINFGPYIKDPKGFEAALVWGRKLFQWEMTSLPMDNLDNLTYEENLSATGNPTFYKGEFDVDEVADTFIKPSGFNKGFILINGINIGRYYNSAGPQKTLYIPKCFLQKGKNEVVIFDSEGKSVPYAELTDKMEL